MLWEHVNPSLCLIQLTQSDSPKPKKSISKERGGEGFMALPNNLNHRYLSVWKTIPSEARITRDEVSGDKNAKTAVWKTVPNYELLKFPTPKKTRHLHM